MRNATAPKMCSSGMFELFAFLSNTWQKCVVQDVQEENSIGIISYTEVEHCPKVFEKLVREISLLLEHDTAPLEGAGYVRAGRQDQSLPIIRGNNGPAIFRPLARLFTPVKFSRTSARTGNRRSLGAQVGHSIRITHSPCLAARSYRQASGRRCVLPQCATRPAAGHVLTPLWYGRQPLSRNGSAGKAGCLERSPAGLPALSQPGASPGKAARDTGARLHLFHSQPKEF